jgi:hypothetical protein
MRTLQIVSVALLLAAAACGGKSKGGATAGGGTGGEGDDAATPFDDASVKKAIASTAGVDACGVDASTTMGAHFEAQREALKGGPDGTTPLNESFLCRAQPNNTWECQWSIFTVATGGDPDDPCAGEGEGSGYIIIVTVGNDGAVDAGSIACNAPG